jgi:hypothetical protein
MNYLDTSKRIRNEIETKKRLSGLFKESSTLHESNYFLSLTYERNELNERNALKLEEIVCRYRERGWIQIYSTRLNVNIYFLRHKSIKVPDSSLPKYTKAEVDALRGLSLDELKTLHEAKIIFGGNIHEK